MTASNRDQRSQSFDDAHEGPASSDFVASRTESLDSAIGPLEKHPIDLANMRLELENALRATRTPLIAGVDFEASASHRNALLPGAERPEAFEKSRVDTLSPIESVPPPAPYPSEPPPPRPSVVPPVRRPYSDQQSPRARVEPTSTGLRSDPPPRIAISDRPSRPVYRSDPPPRHSRSDPPPQSSRRGSPNHRRSWGDADYGPSDAMADSPDARRREAATIPADAYSPSQAAYDPSMPLPALRAPSFSVGHLPLSARQHENSRLRFVAMTMMFVIFIVTGAIAGMRWYVARGEESPVAHAVADSTGPRAPKLKLDRLEPNALIAPRHSATDPSKPEVETPPKSTLSNRATSKPTVTPDRTEPDTAKAPNSIASPWTVSASADAPADTVLPEPPVAHKATRTNGGNKPSTKKTTPSRGLRSRNNGVLDPRKVDTKTPLIMD